MDDIKISLGEDEKPQSKVEREKELIDQHEQEKEQDSKEKKVDDGVARMEWPKPEEKKEEVKEEVKSADDNKEEVKEDVKTPITDEEVLSFIAEKTGRDINSFDDLIEIRKEQVELEEDVAAFQKYKQETGRTLKDYIESTRDFDAISDDEVIRLYYSNKYEGLDPEDIDFKINKEFKIGDLDDDDDIKQKELDKKLRAREARNFLNEQKEQYNIPLESRSSFVPEEEREAYNSFKQQQENAKQASDNARELSEYFEKQTNDLFSNEFKGFEFSIGDDNVVYEVNDIEGLKSRQSDVNNFISQHLDEKGRLKDANAYHKSLFAGMDPDGFAKFIWEKAYAKAVEDGAKASKNIDMDPRSVASPKTSSSGLKMSVPNPPPRRSGGLRIKK